MAISVELKVLALKCNKLSERNDDEIYFVTEAVYPGDEQNITVRYPNKDREVIVFKKGEAKALEAELFYGAVSKKGVTLTVRVMEQDLGGLLSNVVGKIDDLIGEAVFTVPATNDPVTAKAGQSSKYIGTDENGHHVFQLTGSDSDYSLTLSVLAR